MAWFWLPETVHRAAAGTGMPFRNLSEMMQRPGLRRMLWIDFIYWFAFAIFQTTFALFVARRFGFDVSQTGYFFAAFGVLGAVVQGAFIRPIVHRLGDKPTFILGLVCATVGLVGATLRAFGCAVQHRAHAAGVRHRFRPSDGVRAGQPRRPPRRAGTRAGCGRRDGKPGPRAGAGLGQRGARALRRRRCRTCRLPSASR